MPSVAFTALAGTVPQPIDLRARATEVAALMKALANADRLLLLCQLAGGELGVTELGRRAHVDQPSLSQQLGVLRGERLVATRRDGRHIHYRIASPAVQALLQTLYTLFCNPPAAAVAGGPAPGGRRSPRRRIPTE